MLISEDLGQYKIYIEIFFIYFLNPAIQQMITYTSTVIMCRGAERKNAGNANENSRQQVQSKMKVNVANRPNHSTSENGEQICTMCHWYSRMIASGFHVFLIVFLGRAVHFNLSSRQIISNLLKVDQWTI